MCLLIIQMELVCSHPAYFQSDDRTAHRIGTATFEMFFVKTDKISIVLPLTQHATSHQDVK